MWVCSFESVAYIHAGHSRFFLATNATFAGLYLQGSRALSGTLPPPGDGGVHFRCWRPARAWLCSFHQQSIGPTDSHYPPLTAGLGRSPSFGRALTIFTVSRLTVTTWPTKRITYSGSSSRLGSLVIASAYELVHAPTGLPSH